MHQNVPFSTWKSKKNFWGRGTAPFSRPLPMRGGNTKMKHSNQYNFILLQSAKMTPRMHQNAPFSTQKSKKTWETPPVERGKPPPDVPFSALILEPSFITEVKTCNN